MVSVPLPAGQPPNAASVLAAWIASRNEQSEPLPNSSLVVVTVIVPAAPVGWAGPTTNSADTMTRVSASTKRRRFSGAHLAPGVIQSRGGASIATAATAHKRG